MRVRKSFRSSARGIGAVLAATAVVVAGLVAVPTAAQADSAPNPGVSETVTSDPLPTVQINGIIWDQVIVGKTVYAVGQFSSARPAGSPAGTNEVPRSNILAYDIETGDLLPFAPVVNGQVRTIAASPDGSRIYIGGDFTAVDGSTRNRAAAFYTATGRALTSWTPSVNASVRGIAATNTTVYLTGVFGRVSSNDRSRAAAVAATGELLPWAPVLNNRGNDIIVSPDGSKVAIAGHFSTVNGSSNPGYGMALLDSSTAALLPMPANTVVRNGGDDAAIWSLSTDGPHIYATGYTFGSGGNLEGILKTNWDSGSVDWVEDCHGDTYSAYATPGAVYAATHVHYCGSLVDGFPESTPRSHYRGAAFGNSVERITPAGLGEGYKDWGGTPAPRLLHWFPEFNTGEISGSSQGPWSVTGNDEYVVMAGEFTTVNNKGQQGLVRFVRADKAPNADGPRLGGSQWVPTASSSVARSVRISWPVNWDRDNENLTYKVIRDGDLANPVHTITARSKPAIYALPDMSFLDQGLEQGSTHTYRLRAEDPHGNVTWSETITATVNGGQATNPYADMVMADAPAHYWPLNDSGTSSTDWAGSNDLVMRSGATRNVPGALTPTSIAATAFASGWLSNGYASTAKAELAPQTFSIETWFKTTSTAGGKIIGFGDKATGASSANDRNVYLDTAGRVNFGVYPGAQRVITSPASYNDGAWHHVVATLDATKGQQLYIDGVKIGQRPDVTTAQVINGYWRIAGDTSWSGANYLDGTIDEVAIYPAALDREQIREHYTASGRTTVAVPSDVYGARIAADEPSLYWRLNETTGAVAGDGVGTGVRGNYVGTHTKSAAGALSGSADTSVNFTNGQVISQKSFANPTTYSAEAWFNTTSAAGGKILGFGNSSSATLSSSYDRHVYMTNAGKIAFGATSGGQVVLTSANSYNDGVWHHVVATQGASGMRLYVDGAEVGTNTNAVSGNYTGYWHVGGDRSWGPGGNPFTGRIDEVAVYPNALSAKTVEDHFSLGAKGAVPNLLPTASFTAEQRKLITTVSAAASADQDGSIVEYRWNWGDASAETLGVNTEHEYAEPGTYTVTLTVTDDRGAEATHTSDVVAIANQAPVAAFTPTVLGLSVTVDSSASTDADGTIASRVWSWGDGSPDQAGEATATHAYAEAGTYTVTLAVTDDDGTVSNTQQQVVITEPQETVALASDAFERTAATGLGTADVGGAWTLANGASNFATDGAGVFRLTSGGSLRTAYLTEVASVKTDVTVDVTVDALPVGGTIFAQAIARRVGADDYRGRITIAANGTVTLQVVRNGTSLGSVPVPGLTLTPGTPVTLRVDATGTNPTTISAKAWPKGAAEPADWQLSRTDSTAVLQTPGQIGLAAYSGAGVTNVPYLVRFDNLRAVQPGTAAPNVMPVAAFASTTSDLTAAFDAAGSADPDGSIARYEWNFGDESTGTGVTATHQYAAAGTYTVRLRVVDDRGGEHTVSRDVTVTAPATPEEPDEPDEPAPAALAGDEFDRSATASWGTAATGGAWTLSTSSVSGYSVDGASARIGVGAGSTRAAYLADVSSASTDLTASAALEQLPVGGTAYSSFIARRVGAEDYRARVTVAANGAVQLQLQRTATTLAAVNVPGVTMAAGEEFQVRVQAFGTAPTTLRAKVWKAGTAEPTDWQVSTVDETAGLQTAGHIGLGAYVSGSATNVPLTFVFGRLAAVPVAP